jgi:hypothetical protein
MESIKTNSERYYDALLVDPREAAKILKKILEDEKHMEKKKELKKKCYGKK